MALVDGTNCGFCAVAPTTDPGGFIDENIDSQAGASKFTSPATAIKVTEIGWWCDNATEAANFQVGIYTHDTTNNRPLDLLTGSSGDVAKGTDAGWKKATGLNITIEPNTIYWIAVQCDDTITGTSIVYGSGARQCFKSSQTSLPSSWGTSDSTYNGYIDCFYAVWEAAATSPTFTSINIGDAWKTISGASVMQINIGDTWKAVSGAQINIGDAWKKVTLS